MTLHSDEPLEKALQQAWQALHQNEAAQACKILEPWAPDTQTNVKVAEVWAAMLAHVDDETYLLKEVKRFAHFWLKESSIIILLAQSILQWRKRQPSLQSVAQPDDLIGMIIQVINLSLHESPPSQSSQRAQLYHLHAQLLCYGDLAAESLALESFEIAIALDAQASMWYHLARLHLLRARWYKAFLASMQAKQMQLDAKQLEYCIAWSLNAKGIDTQEEQDILADSWHALEYENLHLHAQQKRYVFQEQAEPVLVAIHTHMVSVNGLCDLQADWKYEVVWVQALSPCHGRLLHPPISINQVGFDDLIIWDAQPALFEEVEEQEQVIMKAIACLAYGKAHTRFYPKPLLNESQLDTLNQALPTGIFYYQSSKQEQEHGALCWPRDCEYSVQQIIHRFEQKYQQLHA